MSAPEPPSALLTRACACRQLPWPSPFVVCSQSVAGRSRSALEVLLLPTHTKGQGDRLVAMTLLLGAPKSTTVRPY